MKTNKMKCCDASKAGLQGDSLRKLVENIQYALVAPRLLQSDGWNTFEMRLNDQEVATVARFAGIGANRKLSARKVQRMCACITAALYARLLLEEGLAEQVTRADGECAIRLTDAGVIYAARVQNENAA